jgi:membrane protease YdiL (CAAX protease family)
MFMNEQFTTAAPAPELTHAPRRFEPVASYLHTLIIVAAMIAVGVMTMMSFRQGRLPAGPLLTYLPTIIWLWLLAAIVYLGMRRRGRSLRDVVGQSWISFDDALMDFVIAGAFWIAAMIVLVALGFLLMKLTGTPQPSGIPSELRHLAPRGALGIALWIVLSLTAGICEEFIFRGYLQRQMLALTQSPVVGILLAAAVFALGHLYEGGMKTVLIFIYGALFGALAYWRRNLRPGMIAHAWHDIFAGLVLAVLTSSTVQK